MPEADPMEGPYAALLQLRERLAGLLETINDRPYVYPWVPKACEHNVLARRMASWLR